MVGVTLLALMLYGAVWVVHYLLQVVISVSLDVEERDLRSASGIKKYGHLKNISILQALEIIIAIVFTAVLPVVGIVIGAILPDPVRSALSGAVGANTVIIVTLVALFAYWSVFRTLRKHQGQRVREAVIRLFRSTAP
jgi:protein-S-isoprenylcysteine O-methyltransferase Ste14